MEKSKCTLPALKIATIYAIFGGLWILLSDKLLGLMVPDMNTYATIQTWKGWLYIAVTALLIFCLSRRSHRELAAAQKELEVSERRYRMSTDAAQVGTWEWDVPTGDLILNAQYIRTLGYDGDKFPPVLASWEALLHPRDKDRVLDALNAHLRGETEEFESRHRLLAGDGHWKWFIDRGRVFLRDENGAPLKAIGVQMPLHGDNELTGEAA
ncbi:PAS domain-containing protein [Pseudodesulfovibrio sp.]|uniref:PAS domain-containing protein n=1 Tax=Pseudodesulfovibrio sp. TaxID=2035812 RepID=UPI00260DB490|nr:PAS domain-containing protein [Pseudodesulfovibrio sp.]MDD3313774.1 PAS domain-containing protein [Pseudodesulfovibrio sp.]